MKKLKKLCLRKNDILTDESMGNIIGGYDLPEVVVYGTAPYHHTGDPSTCHECSRKLPGTDDWGMGSSIYTYYIWAYCLLHKGEPCQ
jgi:hypothetical protein